MDKAERERLRALCEGYTKPKELGEAAVQAYNIREIATPAYIAALLAALDKSEARVALERKRADAAEARLANAQSTTVENALIRAEQAEADAVKLCELEQQAKARENHALDERDAALAVIERVRKWSLGSPYPWGRSYRTAQMQIKGILASLDSAEPTSEDTDD